MSELSFTHVPTYGETVIVLSLGPNRHPERAPAVGDAVFVADCNPDPSGFLCINGSLMKVRPASGLSKANPKTYEVIATSELWEVK